MGWQKTLFFFILPNCRRPGWKGLWENLDNLTMRQPLLPLRIRSAYCSRTYLLQHGRPVHRDSCGPHPYLQQPLSRDEKGRDIRPAHAAPRAGPRGAQSLEPGARSCDEGLELGARVRVRSSCRLRGPAARLPLPRTAGGGRERPSETRPRRGRPDRRRTAASASPSEGRF